MKRQTLIGEERGEATDLSAEESEKTVARKDGRDREVVEGSVDTKQTLENESDKEISKEA
jgi:hypothetical protein